MSKPSNLFASLSNLLSSLLGIAQTRLELLANELEEQKAHLIKLFYYSMLMLFFFSVGLLNEKVRAICQAKRTVRTHS